MPGTSSVTKVVPPAVPSLLHSSTPLVPSLALKKRVPFTFVRYFGSQPTLPGRMSLTSIVLAAVPSVLHSSEPLTPSLATKKALFPTSVIEAGDEDVVEVLSRGTTKVPLAV